MINCKKKCSYCGEYVPCRGYQVINMNYCKKCKKKLGIRTISPKTRKIKTMIKKTDNKEMTRWQKEIQVKTKVE